jgi:hypothetical protein
VFFKFKKKMNFFPLCKLASFEMNTSVFYRSEKSSGCSNGASPVLFNLRVVSAKNPGITYVVIAHLTKVGVVVTVCEYKGLSLYEVECIEGCTFDAFVDLMSRLHVGRACSSNAAVMLKSGNSVALYQILACPNGYVRVNKCNSKSQSLPFGGVRLTCTTDCVGVIHKCWWWVAVARMC